MTEIMSCKYKVKIDELVCTKRKDISSIMLLELIVIDIRETCYITKKKQMVIIFHGICI